jgi:hypothetical protein
MSIMQQKYPPFPFLIGAPRSGTTLLRLMLDAHPHLAIPPETGFLSTLGKPRLRFDARRQFFMTITEFPRDAPNWIDFDLDAEALFNELLKIEPFHLPEGIRTFYRMYAAKQGKPRYGDKTPGYCQYIRRIGKVLPEARWIHIIRDGRDVVLSLRRTWFSPSPDMTTLAAYWRKTVRRAMRDGRGSASYLEVRYENLIGDPQSVLEEICELIQIDFDPIMLRYWERSPARLMEHRERRRTDGKLVVSREQRLNQQKLTMEPPRADRIGIWKTEMSQTEQIAFRRGAGDLLEELRYEW